MVMVMTFKTLNAVIMNQNQNCDYEFTMQHEEDASPLPHNVFPHVNENQNVKFFTVENT